MKNLSLKFLAIALFVIVMFFGLLRSTYAQNSINEGSEFPEVEAKVIDISQGECLENPGRCTFYKLEILEGEEKGSQAEAFELIEDYTETFVKGQSVFIQKTKSFDEGYTYVIIGPVREVGLGFLLAIFVIVTLIVAKWKGLGSLAGLLLSIVILFVFTIPAIINGFNPILAGYLAAIVILASSIYLAHGFNAKSNTAFLATVIGMVVISFITLIFMEFTKLTGLGNENSLYLITGLDNIINIKGVLFASIIVGGVGIMDDATVNQISVMHQLLLTDPKLTTKELYYKAMEVGKDHISSMVNTLFMAYAGASMPLVMLLQANEVNLRQLINNELFAEEIVRTLVGSTGIILVFPIASLIGAYLISRNKAKWLSDKNHSSHSHTHVH